MKAHKRDKAKVKPGKILRTQNLFNERCQIMNTLILFVTILLIDYNQSYGRPAQQPSAESIKDKQESVASLSLETVETQMVTFKGNQDVRTGPAEELSGKRSLNGNNTTRNKDIGTNGQSIENAKKVDVGKRGDILPSTENDQMKEGANTSKFFPILVVVGIVITALTLSATVKICSKKGIRCQQRVNSTDGGYGGHGQPRKTNGFDYVHSVL